MQVLYECCAGLDVHKKTVTACIRRVGEGGKPNVQIREFATMTATLLELADWLVGEGVTHVAMESTGVFWKPIWNLLEGQFELLLCNPQHLKQVPGRKTDVKDSEWLAQLLQHGLLSGSFVPRRPLRELRDLTRQRAQLTHEKASVANRIHKTLEDANIKLGSVATDILGVSGRAMIEAIIGGEDDPQKLADLARRRLKNKKEQLQLALHGRVRDHHRFMLDRLYRHLLHLEALISDFTLRIDAVLNAEEINDASQSESGQEHDPLPFPEAADLLTTTPGVQRHTAECVLAEIGTDMSRFPSAAHLASWAGLCPGNHESAGKRKSGRTTKGNPSLRSALTRAAWAASHTKNTYLSAQYRRLARRRGKKRAIIAVAHSILVANYHMLRNHQRYVDLGPDHFDQITPDRLKRYHVKRLEAMGYVVTLATEPEAA